MPENSDAIYLSEDQRMLLEEQMLAELQHGNYSPEETDAELLKWRSVYLGIGYSALKEIK